MLLLLLLFGLALGSDVPQVKLQRGSCPMFWYNFNDRCYKYVSSRLSWADAELFCVSQGANLVSIYSLEEHNFVKNLTKNFDHFEGYTWIGLSDLHKEGGWMWSDGCAVDFKFWDSGQPDNAEEGEHCVHNNFGQDKKWNDRPCSVTYASVCASRITCP